MTYCRWWLGLTNCLFILHCIRITQATNYAVIGDRTTFFVPCSRADGGPGNLPLHKIVDFSGLQYTYGDDMETVYTNGDIKVLANVPNSAVKVTMEMFSKEMGKWVPTNLKMTRKNICQAIFDPKELWFFLVMGIPQNQRVCPPDIGTIYTIKNTTNRLFLSNLPSSDIEGSYKIRLRLEVGKYRSCSAAFIDIHQV